MGSKSRPLNSYGKLNSAVLKTQKLVDKLVNKMRKLMYVGKR